MISWDDLSPFLPLLQTCQTSVCTGSTQSCICCPAWIWTETTAKCCCPPIITWDTPSLSPSLRYGTAWSLPLTAAFSQLNPQRPSDLALRKQENVTWNQLWWCRASGNGINLLDFLIFMPDLLIQLHALFNSSYFILKFKKRNNTKSLSGGLKRPPWCCVHRSWH